MAKTNEELIGELEDAVLVLADRIAALEGYLGLVRSSELIGDRQPETARIMEDFEAGRVPHYVDGKRVN